MLLSAGVTLLDSVRGKDFVVAAVNGILGTFIVAAVYVPPV